MLKKIKIKKKAHKFI